MTTTNSNPLITALIIICVVGCGKSSETKRDDTPSESQPVITAKQEPINPPFHPKPTPVKPDEQPLIPHSGLSSKIKGRTSGAHGAPSIVAMRRLLQQWTPVGKSVSDVKSMLGSPTEENATQLLYLFDNGVSTYEWILVVTNGAITSISVVTGG